MVSYNSADTLRACVESLAGHADLNVIVADNASTDDALGAVSDLPVTAISTGRNGGFSFGVNAGWRAGTAPYVLILNPDARCDRDAIARMAAVLLAHPEVAAVAPRILNEDGSLQWSLRRFPRLASTFATALFLQRLWPRATWADEVIRDPAVYGRPSRPEWVSGACLMVRRTVLERLGGLDEGFFLYCEDKDLCRRIRDVHLEVAYEPTAVCVHVGGASAPRAGLLAILAQSRVRYARLHDEPPVALLQRVGIGLGCLTHALLGRGGASARRGHLRALMTVITGRVP